MDGDPLTSEQQQKLDKVKVDTAVANEKYLRTHPEVERMIQVFIRTLLEQRPEQPVKFTADFFCQDQLKQIVEQNYNDKHPSLSCLENTWSLLHPWLMLMQSERLIRL